MTTIAKITGEAAEAVKLTEASMRKFIDGKDLGMSTVLLRSRASNLLAQMLSIIHTTAFTSKQPAAVRKLLLGAEDSHFRSFMEGSATLAQIGVLRELLKIAHCVFEADAKGTFTGLNEETI